MHRSTESLKKIDVFQTIENNFWKGRDYISTPLCHECPEVKSGHNAGLMYTAILRIPLRFTVSSGTANLGEIERLFWCFILKHRSRDLAPLSMGFFPSLLLLFPFQVSLTTV